MEPKETLLEKAKKVVVREIVKNEFVDDETLDLIFAYFAGEISNKQLTVAAELAPNEASGYINRALLAGVRCGKIIRKP